jgi:hypothetical protein
MYPGSAGAADSGETYGGWVWIPEELDDSQGYEPQSHAIEWIEGASAEFDETVSSVQIA